VAAGFTFKNADTPNSRAYRIGDVVTVYPEAKLRAPVSPGSRLSILIVADATERDLQQLIEPHLDGQGRNVAPSIWNLSPAALPAQAQVDLANSRKATITFEQLLDSAFRKGEVAVTARTHGITRLDPEEQPAAGGGR
jgi:hypothetical protein